MSADTGNLISRIYGNFRGVDFRGEDVNLSRSPDAVNVWKDYREIESIRTRPLKHLFWIAHYSPSNGGFKPVYGFFFFKDKMFIHQDNVLYYHDMKSNKAIPHYLSYDMNPASSMFFAYGDGLYIIDGKNYLLYDDTRDLLTAVTPYVPTTTIGRNPAGGGTVHEDVNLLSDRRINTFLGDGKSTDYFLDAYGETYDNTDMIVKVNDVVLTQGKDYSYMANDAGDMVGVTFTTAPAAPLTDGQDNVSVEFTRKVAGNKEKILGCTLLQVFDNRVFVSGNPDYPNTVWHCSLNSPGYFSDLDYYQEGTDSAAITGLVAGNNALWVFREPSSTNTNVFYHTPTIDDEYGKIYPSVHSSITTGCIGKAINFNDDIVFFSRRGMEGISGDVTTEQAVAHRSTVVDRKLLAEANYKNMILEEWEGYLLVIIDNKIYLADSRAVFTNVDHMEYEWFYWEFDRKISCAKVYNGALYWIDDQGMIRVMSSSGENLYALGDQYAARYVNCASHWVTPKDKFNAPHKLKTTNKRGCVVEATGDITVSAKVEDTDFEPIGSYENVTDYFVSRIKRKKWKDIQLKFSSETRFSLETATLEAFIGGYIKR